MNNDFPMDGPDSLAEVETRPSEVRSKALLGCPFCGRDTGCYHEIFEITHKSMGFDKPRIQAVVYCHDCGAMAPTEAWYMRQPNAKLHSSECSEAERR